MGNKKHRQNTKKLLERLGTMKTDIIVLNYNGVDLIPECLPSIVASSKASVHDVNVVVIDNESKDNSMKVLEGFTGDVEVIEHTNEVFCSFNDVVASRNSDIVILLNNDIRVEEDFIDPLVEVFKNEPDAFLVGPKVLTFDGERYEGTLAKWWIDKGVFKSSSRFPGYESLIDSPNYTAQAGFGAFRRDRFLELGGYDDLYLPGIMEDADLCYRAWKKGYKGYYQPKSRMYHKAQSAFSAKFGRYGILKMSHRNTYLFMWKNITDIGILSNSILYLLPRILFALVRGKFEIPLGFFSALGRLPRALAKRSGQKSGTVLSDREVIDMFKNIGEEA